MKTPRMTGKVIILRYLETHARFSAPELVEKLGYLRLHLDDENLVQEVLMMLRKV